MIRNRRGLLPSPLTQYFRKIQERKHGNKLDRKNLLETATIKLMIQVEQCNYLENRNAYGSGQLNGI